MSEVKRPCTPQTGRVLRVDAKVCHVEVDGKVVQAVPRGALFEDLGEVKNPVAVGDRVRVDLSGDPASLVEVLPRRNHLSRVTSSHDPREQVLFANVDQLFAIASLKHPKFSSNCTDRILAACAYHEIPATLVLNKVDLDKRGVREEIRRTYQAAGVPVLETSAKSGLGLDELAERLRGRTSSFYGPSGVGKSTLLNSLEPTLNLKVGKISKHWEQGRHTTTFSQLLRLHSLDAEVIDTPGIRVFRLFGVNRRELRDLFCEFRPYAEKCRYPDCTHTHEPQCAVLDAVEAGEIPLTRFASYVEMLDELAPPPDEVPEAEGVEEA